MRTIGSLSLAASLTVASLVANVSQAAPHKEVVINEVNFNKLNANDQQRVLEIKSRLEEITTLDRSSLSKEERSSLRTEVKALDREIKDYNRSGTVIYISTAGIIIILLILIILL